MMLLLLLLEVPGRKSAVNCRGSGAVSRAEKFRPDGKREFLVNAHSDTRLIRMGMAERDGSIARGMFEGNTWPNVSFR